MNCGADGNQRRETKGDVLRILGPEYNVDTLVVSPTTDICVYI